MRKINNSMSGLLYVVAVILVIIWAINYFVLIAGNIVHVLLVLAVVAVLIRIIKGKAI